MSPRQGSKRHGEDSRWDAATIHFITDDQPTQAGWAAYIGAEAKAKGKGTTAATQCTRGYASIQSTPLDYTVRIVHATNAAGKLLYWGDSNTDGLPERNTTNGRDRISIGSPVTARQPTRIR